MKSNRTIISITREYVSKLLTEKLSKTYLYHNLAHTQDVVRGARAIAKALKVSAEDLEIITLAAWFHDIGYSISAKNHEALGIGIAKKFLVQHKYPTLKIKQIIGCIRATKVPQKPKTILEQIVCDADLLYLGKPNAIQRGDTLRREFELHQNKKKSEADWLKQSVQFFKKHHFHTSFVIEKYEPIRQKNLLQIRARIAKLSS